MVLCKQHNHTESEQKFTVHDDFEINNLLG